MEAVLLGLIAKHTGEAPNEETGGATDGENQDRPTVEAHARPLSRVFQVRTARPIRRRKRAATTKTKSRAMRTEWEVWMACQLEDQVWWSQRTKTVRRKTGEM